MGPWGLHYERTQTWWEQSLPWHQYLARCQYLLQQGLFVADICYLASGSNSAKHGALQSNAIVRNTISMVAHQKWFLNVCP